MKHFNDCLKIEIVKAYNKPITRQTEEGTFMMYIEGELLNSKTEWHQPNIVRTTIYTGGEELAGGRVLSSPQDGSQSTQGTIASVSAEDGGPGSNNPGQPLRLGDQTE